MPSSSEIPIRLRPLCSSDLNELYAIDQVCFPEGIAYSYPELRWLLSLPGSFGFAAVTDSDGKNGGIGIAGFIIAGQENPGTGRIITIDVLEGYRRLSLGRKLMELAEEQFIQRKASRIILEVGAENFGAQEFYRVLGYQRGRRIGGYYPTGEDAFVMTKPLDH
jgi:[ribosomal protein S18]-alanine N-acetyltransferase